MKRFFRTKDCILHFWADQMFHLIMAEIKTETVEMKSSIGSGIRNFNAKRI